VSSAVYVSSWSAVHWSCVVCPLSVSSISSAVVDWHEICWNGLSNVLFRGHRDCHGLQTVSFLAPSNTHSCSGPQSLQHNIGKEAIYKWILVWWRKKSWAVGHKIPKMAQATYEFMPKQQKHQYQWFLSLFIARRVVSPVLRPYVISQPNTHKTPAKQQKMRERGKGMTTRRSTWGFWRILE